MTTDMKKPREQTGANSKCRDTVDPTTQAGRILEALRGGPKSAFELILRLQIADPRPGVKTLRDRGWSIVTEPHPHPSRPNERIKRYRLVEPE